MYHLNSQLPAPYQLNQNPSMTPQQQGMAQQPQAQPMGMQAPQTPQYFAKGGNVRGKMVLAHFNPNELHALDHLQGGGKRCSKSGLRSYEHLEELSKNPHLLESIHKHARKHHAEGGSTYGHPELEHLAAGGRHGDTELALIGPNTHHLFNQLAGHVTRNPNTGHPEYWSLGGALGGLWNAIKGGAGHAWNAVKGIGRAAAPHLIPMAQKALGNRFGEMGKAVGGFLPNAANMAFGEGGEENPSYKAIGEGIGRGAKAYQGGLSGGEAFGHGMQAAGSRMGNSGLGGAMQGFGSSLSQGQGLGESVKHGANMAFNNMGGMGGIGKAAQNIMAARPHGIGGMQEAAGQQLHQMGQRFMQNPEEMQQQMQPQMAG